MDEYAIAETNYKAGSKSLKGGVVYIDEATDDIIIEYQKLYDSMKDKESTSFNIEAKNKYAKVTVYKEVKLIKIEPPSEQKEASEEVTEAIV